MAEGQKSIPKLHYYNFRGRAEVVRHVFAAGGLKFEDCRFSREEWLALKPDTPFGQCPYLEIDGKKYAQSVALANYAAREGGLYGKTNLDALKIDQVSMLMEDFVVLIGSFYHETDQEKLGQMVAKFTTKDCPNLFGHFEKMLKDNGTGFVVGDSLSMADVVIYSTITSLSTNEKLKALVPSTDNYPLVKALLATVAENKGIKEYEERRAKLEAELPQ